MLYSPECIEQLVGMTADEIYRMKKMKPGIKRRRKQGEVNFMLKCIKNLSPNSVEALSCLKAE